VTYSGDSGPERQAYWFIATDHDTGGGNIWALQDFGKIDMFYLYRVGIWALAIMQIFFPWWLKYKRARCSCGGSLYVIFYEVFKFER